jgi:hypothetical protein
MTDVKQRWLTHPVRLSGFTALALLVGPGSLAGLSMLLAHAGYGGFLPPVSPRVHAMLQCVGYFVVLIWGFLVHGLPGMLSADSRRTVRMRLPIVATGLSAAAVYGSEAFGAGRAAAWLALAVSTAAGSYIMLDAALRAKLSWIERPFPMLVFPLAMPPFAVAFAYGRPQGTPAAGDGSDYLLFGCIVPVIIAMGYRMFPSMVGLKFPRERAFDASALLWFAGVLLRVVAPESPWSNVILLMAALGFADSQRVFAPRRTASALPPVDAAMLAYVRTGYALLVLAPLVATLAAAGLLGGVGYYWADAARHLVSIGFALLVVMGITQRVLPIYLRGRRASPGVMWLVWGLVTAGVLLRLAEGYLPGTGAATAAAGGLLYAGVVVYVLHVLRGMVVAAPPGPDLHSRHRQPSHAQPDT